MTEPKKEKDEITDITGKKELDEKEMEKVSGGLFVPRTFASKDDCGGNCMGSVPTATGKEIDL